MTPSRPAAALSLPSCSPICNVEVGDRGVATALPASQPNPRGPRHSTGPPFSGQKAVSYITRHSSITRNVTTALLPFSFSSLDRAFLSNRVCTYVYYLSIRLSIQPLLTPRPSRSWIILVPVEMRSISVFSSMGMFSSMMCAYVHSFSINRIIHNDFVCGYQSPRPSGTM
jgi:hypothetical protein